VRGLLRLVHPETPTPSADRSTLGALPVGPETAIEVVAGSPQRILSGTKDQRVPIILFHQTDAAFTARNRMLRVSRTG
jgi:hypothetical protein